MAAVRPTRVYLLNFICPGIQFYLLVSPYLCFISFLDLDLYDKVRYFTDRSKTLPWLIICVFVSCVSHAFASVHCCLVVTCLERAGLLALVCGVLL